MLKIIKDLYMLKAECASEIKGFQNDFRWLSNFFPMESFDYDGITFKTAENFYQAMKSHNRAEREYIASLEPGKAKRYASLQHNKKFIIRDDWEDIRLSVMEYVLRVKFSQQDFKDLLLATRDIYIEETNGWGDVFWGCNTAGEGQNILGKLIQKLRKELSENINLLDYKPVKVSTAKKKNPQP